MGIMAKRLKSARKAKGLSQNELAKLAGTDQGHISRIERGEKGASMDVLTAIVRALDISIAYLLGESISEERAQYSAHQPAHHIIVNDTMPAGLLALADDKMLADMLKITELEWRALSSVTLPSEVDKDGYVQLLIAIRAISTEKLNTA